MLRLDVVDFVKDVIDFGSLGVWCGKVIIVFCFKIKEKWKETF